MSKPEKLSLNIEKMYCASITLKWVKHVKYFENTKKGIDQAVKWGEDLEKLYYPS